ncbi:hypothetical protein [Natronobiforma cellulositropha]|uniref:hypothetical protein n=1 Tax=Natronobiforma cellulositropha TaxID=1679076 RepID=UPI0021D5E6E3|nr:hypothetical protein [Natronobiforma cellulositropha]
MRRRWDRFRAAGSIVAISVLLGLGLLVLADAFSEPLLEYAAVATVLVGCLVFVPLYYLVATWSDETAALGVDPQERDWSR